MEIKQTKFKAWQTTVVKVVVDCDAKYTDGGIELTIPEGDAVTLRDKLNELFAYTDK
tara:strand:- start:1077 stop:1247 length:171 start_codon:yes stop_codon:yes gene_type:complete